MMLGVGRSRSAKGRVMAVDMLMEMNRVGWIVVLRVDGWEGGGWGWGDG